MVTPKRHKFRTICEDINATPAATIRKRTTESRKKLAIGLFQPFSSKGTKGINATHYQNLQKYSYTWVPWVYTKTMESGMAGFSNSLVNIIYVKYDRTTTQLHAWQHAYRVGRSTEIVFFVFTNKIRKKDCESL